MAMAALFRVLPMHRFQRRRVLMVMVAVMVASTCSTRARTRAHSLHSGSMPDPCVPPAGPAPCINRFSFCLRGRPGRAMGRLQGRVGLQPGPPPTQPRDPP